MKHLRNFSRFFNHAELAPLMEHDDTLYIYDFIGEDFWLEGVTPKDVIESLAGFGGRDIDLRVNSPGGYVTDGVAIHTALKNYEGSITAYVDGLAASAASFILTAADEVLMAEGSYIMIHEAHGFSVGTAEDLRKDADVMEMMNANIAKMYAAYGAYDLDKFVALMADETWLDPDSAIESGLATGLQEGHSSPVNRIFDLSNFNDAPETLQRQYLEAKNAPTIEPSNAEDSDSPQPTFTSSEIRKRRLALIEAS